MSTNIFEQTVNRVNNTQEVRDLKNARGTGRKHRKNNVNNSTSSKHSSVWTSILNATAGAIAVGTSAAAMVGIGKSVFGSNDNGTKTGNNDLKNKSIFDVFKKDKIGLTEEQQNQVGELNSAEKAYKKSDEGENDVQVSALMKEIADTNTMIRSQESIIKDRNGKLETETNTKNTNQATMTAIGPQIKAQDDLIKQYSKVPENETTDAQLIRENNLKQAEETLANLTKQYDDAQTAVKEAEAKITQYNEDIKNADARKKELEEIVKKAEKLLEKATKTDNETKDVATA